MLEYWLPFIVYSCKAAPTKAHTDHHNGDLKIMIFSFLSSVMPNHHSINHLIISLTFITGVFAVFRLGEHSGNQNKTTR